MDTVKEKLNGYKIPAELKDVIPGYIGRRDQDVDSLKTFAANQDFDSIGKLGHKLKGNGASFGFDHISELGGLLMKACERHDIAAVKSLVTAFEVEINSIKSVIL